MYTYRFSKVVSKFLDKKDKVFLLRFQKKLEEVIKNPYHPIADVQPYI
jgi:mRNA-degrading endonuclease RelE of RelBE toxin-antitoxin system